MKTLKLAFREICIYSILLVILCITYILSVLIMGSIGNLNEHLVGTVIFCIIDIIIYLYSVVINKYIDKKDIQFKTSMIRCILIVLIVTCTYFIFANRVSNDTYAFILFFEKVCILLSCYLPHLCLAYKES